MRVESMFRVSLTAGVALAALLWPAQAAENKIPNFTFIDSGWLLTGGTNWQNPGPGIEGPVTNDPKYPYVGNNQGAQSTERIADISNPNLKPFAVEKMKARNEEILAGKKRGFVAQSWCWPGGTPGQMLVPAEPIFFIQTPKVVYIIWQRDQNVRRVFLDQPHSKDIKPSVFGESVGHYEGDELVVDTIGLKPGELLFVDNYRTPFTKDLHVVERWKTIDGGKQLQVTVTVDDPGAFNKPWSGIVRWNKVDRGTMQESYCAENNTMDFDSLPRWPMPEATKVDF
jgi:hypothetical protein